MIETRELFRGVDAEEANRRAEAARLNFRLHFPGGQREDFYLPEAYEWRDVLVGTDSAIIPMPVQVQMVEESTVA